MLGLLNCLGCHFFTCVICCFLCCDLLWVTVDWLLLMYVSTLVIYLGGWCDVFDWYTCYLFYWICAWVFVCFVICFMVLRCFVCYFVLHILLAFYTCFLWAVCLLFVCFWGALLWWFVGLHWLLLLLYLLVLVVICLLLLWIVLFLVGFNCFFCFLWLLFSGLFAGLLALCLLDFGVYLVYCALCLVV